MNEIKVSTENVQKPKAVTDRIKTFEDACKELGEEHLFVKQYNSNKMADVDTDLDAYLKLRIICAALNEGWEPQFEEDEYRYYPWFELMTKEEIDHMDEEKRIRVVCRSSSGAYAGGGLVCAGACYVSSYAGANYASRLVFKSNDLAEYAGKQFADIWDDFVFKVR